MRFSRYFVSLSVCAALGAAALVACSDLSPNPPNPHFIDEPSDPLNPAVLDGFDAGSDAQGDAR